MRKYFKYSFGYANAWTLLSWEIKVFKDLWISKVSKNETAINKINMSLDKDIKVWSTYNIFSVFWVEWSADFIVEESLNIKIISQATEAQWISKIIIKDKKNLEIEFKSPLAWNDFEFKLLEDLNVSEINSDSGKLVLKTTSAIENNNDYILIMITLTDKSSNNYVLNESIYDFYIWEDNVLDEVKEDDLNIDLNSALDTPVSNTPNTWTWNLDDWDIWNGTWALLNSTWSTWNMEKIAITAKETPDTWPETLILMVLTLIINSIYFLTRKFAH